MSSSIDIVAGYRPGVIGRCLELQARYYATHAGFGRIFETGRANDIAAFFARDDDPRSRFWCAVQGHEIVGTIAIDATDLGGESAHLRWFIVSDAVRGAGLGRKLLTMALDYVDAAGFPETQLWTFKGLDAARKLYDAAGFVLRDEYAGTQWGPKILEQHFVRRCRQISPDGIAVDPAADPLS